MGLKRQISIRLAEKKAVGAQQGSKASHFTLTRASTPYSVSNGSRGRFFTNKEVPLLFLSLDNAILLPSLAGVSGHRRTGCIALQKSTEVLNHGAEDLDEGTQCSLCSFHGLSLALLRTCLHLLRATDHLKQVILLLQVLGDLLHVQVGHSLLLQELR